MPCVCVFMKYIEGIKNICLFFVCVVISIIIIVSIIFIHLLVIVWE